MSNTHISIHVIRPDSLLNCSINIDFRRNFTFVFGEKIIIQF